MLGSSPKLINLFVHERNQRFYYDGDSQTKPAAQITRRGSVVLAQLVKTDC